MDQAILYKVISLRKQNCSIEKVCADTGVSPTSVRNYMRYAREHNLLTETEIKAIQELDKQRRAEARGIVHGTAKDKNSYSYLRRRNKELTEEVRRLTSLMQGESVTIAPNLKPNESGLLCELFAQYQFRRHGYNAFRPDCVTNALDLLVEVPSGGFARCEVKGCTSGHDVGVKRTGYKTGEFGFVSTPYSTEDKIDFIVAVLLQYEQLFVIPFRETLGKSVICLSPRTSLYSYRDRYDLIDAHMVE